MAVILERLISIERKGKKVFMTRCLRFILFCTKHLANEIPRTPVLKIVFSLKENISNITLFFEVVFLCIDIMLQTEKKNTLQMKAIHEYALGVRVFKVISVLAIKEVLNAVWYKTFSQYFKESLGQTGPFPSKEMRPVEI